MPSADNEYLMRMWEMMSGEDGGNGIKSDVSATVPPVTVDTTAVEAKIGATTDVAVNGDSAGSLSAKARGLNKTIDDAHDATNHALKVNVVAGGGGAVTVADGADATQGLTTATPVSTTAAQTAAASTVMALLKGLINFFISLSKGAGATDATTLRVVTANDGPLNTAIGAGTDAPASITVVQDATARSAISLWKAILNILIGGIKTTDNGPAWASVHGVSGVPFTSADQHSGLASVTDAPTNGQKLVITDLIVSNNSAVAIQFTFKEETSGTPIVTGPLSLQAGMATQYTTRGKAWKISTANKKLQVITDVAGAIMVDAHYFSEP